MGNSSTRSTLSASSPSRLGGGRLGDYVPQALGGPPTPRGSGGIPSSQPTQNASNSYPPSPLRSSGDSSYLEQLRQQAQRPAQQTQCQQPFTAPPAQEVYGPHLPYIRPP